MTDIFPDDYAAAEIGVFWDIEHCTIPDELNAGEALKNIKSAISSGGHRGPVSIRAYGNMTGHELRSITSPQERDTRNIPRCLKTSLPGQLNILNHQI